jgi:cellulose synthase/poly-beta-1,6-N-acetylglucosamine synthase-like glycosyltransferase
MPVFARRIRNLTAWMVGGLLLLFTARRWLFLMAALLPDRRQPQAEPRSWPSVLLLVPARNEAATLPGLFRALDELDYPRSRMNIVLLDDGSSDGSETLMGTWAASRPRCQVWSMGQNVGKAQALNRALDAGPQTEVIVVYDADERPDPDALRALVRPFADSQVGGVSGRRAVDNLLASPAASYAALESAVHQLVTMRAKDRLGLAPALLGSNCAYRRAGLIEVGGFKPGALLEDSDLTVRLARAGWRLRFEPGAVSYHRVPLTLSGYWRQHTRWARGFHDVAGAHGLATLTDRHLAVALRLELLLFAGGYLDRAALLAALILALVSAEVRGFLGRVTIQALLTPLLQVIAALRIGRAPRALWARIAWLPIFFGLDVAMATVGLFNTLKRSPQTWEERWRRE